MIAHCPSPGSPLRQVREGLSYIRQDRVLMLTVTAMFVVFVAAYNFQVIVPIRAFRELGGSSALFGVLMSTLGWGVWPVRCSWLRG